MDGARRDKLMLSDRLLGLVLALIAVIAIGLTAAVIWVSTATH